MPVISICNSRIGPSGTLPVNPLELQIRSCGHSSWIDYQKPYKLKLSKKSSLHSAIYIINNKLILI